MTRTYGRIFITPSATVNISEQYLDNEWNGNNPHQQEV